MIEFTHSACRFTSVIIPSHTSLSNCFVCILHSYRDRMWLMLYLSILSFSLIWYGGPGRLPTPWNASANSFDRYSLVVGILCTLPFTMTSESFHSMSGTTGSVKVGLCNLEVCDTPFCCVLGFLFLELFSPSACL